VVTDEDGGSMADQIDRQAYNRNLIEEFRANRGEAGPFADRPLLLLTTTGARTGQARVTPLMYVPDGDRMLLIASNIGAPKHPDWYRNLVAHPDVTVEVRDETFGARATPAEGDEYARLWASITEQYPFFVEHQEKTTRQIPIVIVTRDAGG
jgi:deazaflavin-dependent oxidoreductase (nitroreductase family)